MKWCIVYIQIDIETTHGMYGPVIAEFVTDNIFRITNRTPIDMREISNWKNLLKESSYDPEFEEWEFPPGSLVRCEWVTAERGINLFAVEKVNETDISTASEDKI